MNSFESLGLSATMLKALEKKGFEEPSPIQSMIIPYLLEGDRDVVAKSQTGTGKTAAFGIPVIERLDTAADHVRALVLVPTRELAIQVAEELGTLKYGRNLRVAPVYGGQEMGLQLKHLKRGVDIVVGTPGRLLDHLRRGSLDIASLEYLVLDEADEMLNMGFIEEIEAILEFAPKERHTLLFSATMPKQVLTIAKRYMGSYETIAIERQMTGLTDQIYFEVYEQDKFEALCRIIDMEPDFYGLVFCRTRVDTSDIAQKLEARGYDAEAIHGDITQAQRERIMQRFRDKRANILVATDVAARGIDVNNLTHVINYALPPDPESYVHRIGRTGRAGKQGTAITFVTPREYRTLHFIRKAAGADIRKGKLPKVDDVITAKQARIKAEIENNLQVGGSELYAALASELLSNQDAVDVLAACLKLAFKDELEAGTYREIKEVGQAQASSPDLKGHTRLLMASGHEQGVSPKKLIRFITERTGIPEKRIGDIRIFDDHTFITVPFAEAETILKRCGTQDGKPLITMAKPDQRPVSNHRPYAKPGYAKSGEGKPAYAKSGDSKPGYKKADGAKPSYKKSGEAKTWEPSKRPRKTDY